MRKGIRTRREGLTTILLSHLFQNCLFMYPVVKDTCQRHHVSTFSSGAFGFIRLPEILKDKKWTLKLIENFKRQEVNFKTYWKFSRPLEHYPCILSRIFWTPWISYFKNSTHTNQWYCLSVWSRYFKKALENSWIKMSTVSKYCIWIWGVRIFKGQKVFAKSGAWMERVPEK